MWHSLLSLLATSDQTTITTKEYIPILRLDTSCWPWNNTKVQALLHSLLVSTHKEPSMDMATNDSYVLGIVLPHLSYYIMIGITVFIQSLLSVLFALVIYKLIVTRRNQSMYVSLMGFGIVIPIVLYLPYWFIRFMDIKNNSCIISAVGAHSLIAFRCLEAIYDTSPPHVESSLSNYMFYYGSVVQFEFDPKTGHTIPLSRKTLQERLWIYVKSTFLATVLFSIMHPRSYKLFHDVHTTIEYDSHLYVAIMEWFHWKHLLNNFLLAYLLYHTFVSLSSTVGLLFSFLTGIQTMTLMNDPFLSSTSPSDFWGHRWNRIVQGLLKRGIYIPVRKTFSSTSSSSSSILGLFLTFAVSGFLHEYLLHVVSRKCHWDVFLQKSKTCDIHPNNPSHTTNRTNRLYPTTSTMVDCCFPARIGYHFSFFLWNAIVILLQIMMNRWSRYRNMVSYVPSWLLTLCTLMTVLPIAHWFLDEYIRTRAISGTRLAFPMLVIVPRE